MQVVAHNLLSQFTDRQLNITKKDKEKSTEKLASGYRINRSADDAAGLQISEKLRWQIRGLDKGKHNITDGLSLIGTAEGALTEVHSILQRVRELSIQAYNDTNTRNDREAIQAEIEESLKEIDRIGSTTMFNTKQILQGNPTEIIQVSEDTPVEYIVHDTSYIELPPWVEVDAQMVAHTQYNQAPGTNDSIMYQTQPNGEIWYYGPKNSSIQGAIWYGDTQAGIAAGYTGWNNSIQDNATSMINFKKLTDQSSTAEELFENMYRLIGCQIRFPCGTCSNVHQGITFSGTAAGLNVENDAVIIEYNNGYNYTYGNVNLSDCGYFDKIKSLVDKHAIDTTLTNAQKEAETKDLAGEIARDLRDKVYNAMNTTMANQHFDRVLKTQGDDYSLIVYDYRDQASTTNPNVTDSNVWTNGKVRINVTANRIEPGQIVEAEVPMRIMAGAVSESWLPIHLPLVSSEGLGLIDYDVSRYQEKEQYSESYQKKILDWQTNGYTDTVRQVTENRPVMVFDKMNWSNGEPVPSFKTEMKQMNYTVTERTWRPKPTANPGDITIAMQYDPSSVWVIDEAIDRVSSVRSTLGAEYNRLEYAYNINSNTEENTQAAESRIRDTDMAKEMVDYAKHSILEQAGQSMLAQANQLPQGILSLLQ